MISNKVIVITGASGGIGAELARQLGKQECKLVLAARRELELKQVAEPFGQNAIAVVTDVRDRGNIEYLRNRSLGEFGQVDVWVNNAGRGIGKRVLELNDEDVDEMLAVNLKSAYYGMQAIVPYFQQRGEGHLINVSSFLGRVPRVSYRSIYSAAKAALNSLTANLRMDLAADYPNIHISLVLPPTVSTDFAANALGGTPQVVGTRQMGQQTPEEVAAVIVELIRHPVPEVYTNPASAEIVKQYYQDVAAFEARIAQPSS